MKRRNLFNKAMAGTLAALAAIGFTACDSDQISYDGPDYVMFADSLQSVAIQDDETYHDIPVVATNTCDHDRTYAVEIIDRESNAIEGLHYDLASNTKMYATNYAIQYLVAHSKNYLQIYVFLL